KFRTSTPIRRNSLLISLLAGNLLAETGSSTTASATTQFPQSLIIETLREKPALARPVRGVIFAIRSPPAAYAEFRARSLAVKILFLAPRCLFRRLPTTRARAWRIAGTIQLARPAGLRCRLLGEGGHRLRPGPGSVPGTPAISSY